MWYGYREFEIICHSFLRDEVIVFLFQNCIKRHVSSRFFLFLLRCPERKLRSREDRRVTFVKSCESYNWNKGKMELSLFLIILCVYSTSAVSIIPELKCSVLRFGYGVNFRYEGMLSHSFDRFYMVTKIEIPKVSDLNLTLFQFNYNCSHVVNI